MAPLEIMGLGIVAAWAMMRAALDKYSKTEPRAIHNGIRYASGNAQRCKRFHFINLPGGKWDVLPGLLLPPFWHH